jgi:hypothetical protein
VKIGSVKIGTVYFYQFVMDLSGNYITTNTVFNNGALSRWLGHKESRKSMSNAVLSAG